MLSTSYLNLQTFQTQNRSTGTPRYFFSAHAGNTCYAVYHHLGQICNLKRRIGRISVLAIPSYNSRSLQAFEAWRLIHQ